MAKKKRWFMLGVLGAVTGLVLKLVSGRREEQVEVGRWEPPTTRES